MNSVNTINQNDYNQLVNEINEKLLRYFGENIMSIYLGGSVAYGDAIPYESDLDYNVVVKNNLLETDKTYVNQLIDEMEMKYTFVKGVHIGMLSIEHLKENFFIRFIMEYNTNLIYGHNIAAEMNRTLENSIRPNLETALVRLDFARGAYQDILDGKKKIVSLDTIPDNTYYAARKLARYLIVIEGAYYLMALGKFKSFSIYDVLEELEKESVFSKELLEVSKQIIARPLETGIGHVEFINIVRADMDKLFASLNRMRN